MQQKESKRPNVLSRVGIILAVLLIALTVLVQYQIHANPPPLSINMSSAMGMATTKNPVTALALPEASKPNVQYTLTARVVRRVGLPDAWAYNGVVPGPTLTAHEGDHVRVTLVNNLPVATTIHWHGVQVPNASDGVAGLTQNAVKPGASYVYDYIAKEPGTYWYHSHQETSEQEPKGLFGALIVLPKRPLREYHDYALVYHKADLRAQTLPEFGLSRLAQIFGKQQPDAVAINNQQSVNFPALPGQSVRVRIVNAIAGDMTGTPLSIALLGVTYKVVALDGHDLHNPQDISGRIVQVGAGQRYDLSFIMPNSGVVKLVDVNGAETATIGHGRLDIPKDVQKLPAFDLTDYGAPVNGGLTLSSRFDQNETITLGFKPGGRDGEMEFIHTINGKAFPDTPTIEVQKGEVVHLRFDNRTNEYHPMHLHGHVFAILAVNNKAVTGSPVRMDSVLVPPRGSADVAFVADNPGLWMMHCHVLIHAASGMDMMVVYPNVSTPFTIGTQSGNFPD